MIEKTIYDYMKRRFDGQIPVYMSYPDKAPPRFYLLEKTGGSIENRIAYATFALQSYGVSVNDAARMNLAGINAMLDAAELDSVSAVKLNSDYNFTDTTRKRNRYQAVLNVTHYETE